MRTRITGGSKYHLKALEALIVDTLKKKNEISKKLAIQGAIKTRRVDDVSDEEEVQSEQQP